MKFKGVIIKIGAPEAVTEKFTKQTIELQQEDEYNPMVAIEFGNSTMTKLQGFEVGEEVEVQTNIGSREYNGRYYTSIKGWDIRYSVVQSAKPIAPINEVPMKPKTKKETPANDEPNDELPF